MQVRVQGDHHLAPGRLEAGEDGLVLAEIAVKLQGPQVFRILVVEFGEEVPGAVAGAVVHQDDLEGAPHPGKGAHQPVPQLPEVLFFVVNGNDDGDIGFRREVVLKGATGWVICYLRVSVPLLYRGLIQKKRNLNNIREYH